MAYGLMRMVRDNNSVFVLVGIVVGLEFGMACCNDIQGRAIRSAGVG